MSAKKQEVVEKTFTLDLSNIGAMAKKDKATPKKDTPVAKAQPKVEVKKQTRVGQKQQAAPAAISEKKKPVAVLEAVAPKSQQAKAEVKKTAKVTSVGTGPKKHLRLVVNPDLIVQFEALFKRFAEETQTFWVNTSRVHILALGVLYLENKYEKSNSYFEAPEEFVNFISRRGNRLKSAESGIRKANGEPIFFEAKADIVQGYYNLIYSFLVANEDTQNLSYSASYFFKDFIDLLEDNFKPFCTFGKKHS